ncbi:MAG: FHA domain-containing protein [Bacillota bacterium]|nr:FHA domain-containing protein [Bacillota bacterium]
MTRQKTERKNAADTAEQQFCCRELGADRRLSRWELDWLQGPQQLFLRPWPVQGPGGETWLLYERSGCLSFDELLARRKLGFDDFLGLLVILCRRILSSIDQLLDPENIDISRETLFFLRPQQDLGRVPLGELFAQARLLYLPVEREQPGAASGAEGMDPDDSFLLVRDEESVDIRIPGDGSAVLAHLVEDLLQHYFPAEQALGRQLLGRCYCDVDSFLAWLEEVRQPAGSRRYSLVRRKPGRFRRRAAKKAAQGRRAARGRGGRRAGARFRLPLAGLFVLQLLLLAGIQQLIRLYAAGASAAFAAAAAALLVALIALDVALLLRPEHGPGEDETDYQRRQRLAAAETRRREQRRRLERAIEAGADAIDSQPAFACLYDVTGDGDYQMGQSPVGRAQRFNTDDFMRRRVPLAVLMHNSCYLGSGAGRADIVVDIAHLESVRLRFRRHGGSYRLCDLGGVGEIQLDGKTMPAGEELTLGSRHEIRIGDWKLLYLAPTAGRTAAG